MGKYFRNVVLIALFICGATIAWASGNSEQTTSSTGGSTSETASAANTSMNRLPLVTDGSGFVLACVDNWYPQAPYSNDLPAFKAVAEKTGVKVDWQALPDSQYWPAIKVRIAANSDMPDLFTLPYDMDTYSIAKQGVIMQLDGLIQKDMPNMQEVLKEAPILAKYEKKADGHIYAFTQYWPGWTSLKPYAPFIIRKDWVEKLGLKMPTTTDELYNVLKAFKERDPNGNGKADELPIVVEWAGLGGVLNSLGDLFGLQFNDDSRAASFYAWDSTHTKLINQFTLPAAKEYIAWLAKAYKAGILDPEFAQSNTDVMYAKIGSERAGMVNHWAQNISTFDGLSQKGGDPNADWYALNPPTTPDGQQGHVVGLSPIGQDFGISAKSKKADLVARWLDYYAYSKEGYITKEFGVEGLSYTKDSAGIIHFTPFVYNNPDGLSNQQALWSIGATPNLPVMVPDSSMKSLYVDHSTTLEHDPIVKDASERFAKYTVLPTPKLASTAEENKELARIKADTQPFMQENIMKFIIGEKPMSEWDSFIAQWEKLGMTREEQIFQDMFKRYLEK